LVFAARASPVVLSVAQIWDVTMAARREMELILIRLFDMDSTSAVAAIRAIPRLLPSLSFAGSTPFKVTPILMV